MGVSQSSSQPVMYNYEAFAPSVSSCKLSGKVVDAAASIEEFQEELQRRDIKIMKDAGIMAPANKFILWE